MGKKFVHRNSLSPWLGLLVGCMFTGIIIYNLLTPDLRYLGPKGANIPIWACWIILPIGIGIIAYSIYAIITGKDKPIYTDEEAAQAEAEMDALYLREYGELPKKPKPEMTESKTIEGEIAEPVKPQKGTE